MTKSGDVWTYEGTGTSANIIFNNNNGNQTGDLPFVDGATYDMKGVVGAEVKTYSVYFVNGGNWSDVYVYAWGGVKTADWPGQKLTDKTEDGKYIFNYEATAEPTSGNLIFNNGSGVQSEEFTWETGKTYTYGSETPGDEQWYIVGEGIEDDAAAWSTDHEMTKGENGVWKWTGNIKGAFKFRNAKNWDDSTTVLGTVDTEADTTISGDGSFNLSSNRAAKNFAINAESVTLTLDPSAKTLIISGFVSSGVAAVEAANGEAVYFNMQGVRVANPENGLFIRVQNGKAVKVVK